MDVLDWTQRLKSPEAPRSISIVLQSLQRLLDDPKQISDYFDALYENATVATVSLNFMGFVADRDDETTEKTITIPLTKWLAERESLRKLTLLHTDLSDKSMEECVAKYMKSASANPKLEILVLWDMKFIPADGLVHNFVCRNRNVRQLRIQRSSICRGGQPKKVKLGENVQILEKLSLKAVECSDGGLETIRTCITLLSRRGLSSMELGDIPPYKMLDKDVIFGAESTITHVKLLGESCNSTIRAILEVKTQCSVKSLLMHLGDSDELGTQSWKLESLIRGLPFVSSVTDFALTIPGPHKLSAHDKARFVSACRLNCSLEQLTIIDSLQSFTPAEMAQMQQAPARNKLCREFLEQPSSLDDQQWPELMANLNDRFDSSSSSLCHAVHALAPRFEQYCQPPKRKRTGNSNDNIQDD